MPEPGWEEGAARERRLLDDRRRQRTPVLGPHVLVGRRRGSRRAEEAAGGYVDRYPLREWLLALAILALSLADLLLTLRYLDQGGQEANPVMRWALERGRPTFITLKLAVTAVGVVFLLAHHRFRLARRWLEILFFLYCTLLVYHVWLVQRGGG